MINAIFGHDFDREDDTARCPICEGEGWSIGFLGFLHWFRCRACGMDFSVDTRPHKAAPSKASDASDENV